MLETKLRSLESLGRTKEKFADFLDPLVESCLPESVLRAWERSRVSEDNDNSKSQRSLEKLMCFIRHEVESGEMISLARDGFGKNNRVVKRNNNEVIVADIPDVATTAMLVSTNASHDGIPKERNLAQRETDAKDIDKLHVLNSQLEDKFSRLDEIQNEISSLLLEENTAEYETDFEAAENYRDRYLELKSKVATFLNKNSRCVSECSSKTNAEN
ncbi:hypothetical protein HNY73_011224 [Argiope bruennichi]|uniref:Uncharacterized protein n=1 Tax=Argiope bruennichi TaxID=94029 RepID=A0A8T0F4D9_ARGBR|nr:hypothetical protein HNY73_011224 [Argiope bruennichi]